VIRLVLNTLTVSNNANFGVYLDGAASVGNIAANLRNSTIVSNGNAGVHIGSGSGFTTQEALMFNDISLNGAEGIRFAASSLLSAFVGNSVHANVADQILIAARQLGNATYDLRSPGNACDVNRNLIYCYGSGGVGIRVSSTLSTSVDARNVSWSNSAPTAALDYVVIGAPGSTLDASLACSAITTCP